MAISIDHLREAHRLALRARMNSTANAAVLVRSWPYLTAAARAAHAALPATTDVGRHIERIALVGDGLHDANQRHRQWPGTGSVDPELKPVIEALKAFSKDGNGRVHTIDELGEAEKHLAGVVWSAAHTVVESCRDHLIDLQETMAAGPPSVEHMHEACLVREALSRVAAAENMVVNVVARGGADRSSGTVTLARLVANWDVQAHRALLTNRSTSCLALIARNEAMVQGNFARLVRRAAESGWVDPHAAARLDPALDRLSDSWETVTQRVRDLSWGADAVPSSTFEAASRLSRAFADVAVGDRAAGGKDGLLSTLNSHLASSAALCAAASELVRDGELTAPARAVNRVLIEAADESPMATPVSPADILRGVSIRLPAEARQLLQGPVDEVLRESMESMHRASGLDSSLPANVEGTRIPGPGHASHSLPGVIRNLSVVTPAR